MNTNLERLASALALYVDGGQGKVNYTFTKESLEVYTNEVASMCINIAELYAEPDGTSRDAMAISKAIKNRFGLD